MKNLRTKKDLTAMMSAITVNEGQVFKVNNVERDWS